MSKPTISVVLTTHLAYAKYLERAIKSVVDQSFKDWELVVVYDGTTIDAVSKAAVLKYQDHPVRLVQVKGFGNHTQPKNKGTMEAKGEYIAYLDSDNVYRKDHLAALYKLMLKVNVDVVYGDRVLIHEATGKASPGVKADFSLGVLSKQNFIDTSDVLCKKTSIEAVGGWDEELEYFADWNLWVRMAKNGATFMRLPLVITDYYWHGKNNVLKSKEGLNFDVQGCYIWPDKTIYGPRKNLKVAIYTMTMNRLKYTQETFISMRAKTIYPFEHYVLDQGSTDKTWTWLVDNEKAMSLKLFTENKNLGISAGSNYLVDKIMQGSYDIIIKVDNDAEFLTDGWLEAVVDVYQRTRGVILSPYIEGLIDHPGGSPRVRDGYIAGHYVGIVEHLGGIFSAAPVHAYDTFRWEEGDFLHGLQDSIFSTAMRKKGFILTYLENVRIEHIFPTSTSYDDSKDAESDQNYRKNRVTEKQTRYEEPEHA